MWENPQFLADLVLLTKEIFNGKLHFLRSFLEIVFSRLAIYVKASIIDVWQSPKYRLQ